MAIGKSGESEGGWTATQILVILLIQLVFILDGIDMQILPVAMPAIVSDWGLPLSAFGTAVAAGHLGAVIGTPLAGIMGDRIGRKPVIVGGVLLFALGTLALAFARTPGELATLRVMAGLGLGGCLPPSLALATECLPAHRRGWAIALSMVCPPIGIAISGFLGHWMLPGVGWQNLFLVCGIVPLVAVLLTALFLPESPACLARKAGSEERLSALLTRLNLPPPAPDLSEAKPRMIDSLGDIFAPGRRLGVAGLYISFFLVYLAMSLVLGWLPSLLAANAYPQSLAVTSISAYSLAGIGGILVAGWLMTRKGERPITNGLFAGGIGVAMVLALFMPAPTALGGWPTVLVYSLLGLAGALFNGLMTAMFTCASAAFPPAIRGSGIGLGAMIGRFGALFGGKIGPDVIAIGGTSAYFFVLAGILLAALGLFNIGRYEREGA